MILVNERKKIKQKVQTGWPRYIESLLLFSDVEEDPPVIYDCPEDITRECSSPDDVIHVRWKPPRAVDDLEDVTLSFQSHHLHGDKFSVGNTSVTYVWEDRGGNSAECNFFVFISGE